MKVGYLQKVNKPQCPFTLKDSGIHIYIKKNQCYKNLYDDKASYKRLIDLNVLSYLKIVNFI